MKIQCLICIFKRIKIFTNKLFNLTYQDYSNNFSMLALFIIFINIKKYTKKKLKKEKI